MNIHKTYRTGLDIWAYGKYNADCYESIELRFIERSFETAAILSRQSV